MATFDTLSRYIRQRLDFCPVRRKSHTPTELAFNMRAAVNIVQKGPVLFSL